MILFGSVYYALKSYFDNASREVVENWYATELTNIQQGNALSSVTKLQRTLRRSTLVKGVRVINREGYELVRFGRTYEFPMKDALSDSLSQQDLRLFTKIYAFRSGDLDIFIITESRGLLALVGVLGFYLVFVSIGFAIFLRKTAVNEEKIRSELSLRQLRLENDFNERIVSLSRSVAHDIRSPLSVVNIIANKMKTSSPEEAVLLGEVSKRIIHIAEGLLDASRNSGPSIQKPTIEPTVTPKTILDVKSILKISEHALAEKKLELGNSMIRIQIYNEVVDHFEVFCEESALSRIISNLLNNSIEAIKEKGFVSLTLSQSTEGLYIEIRDSGPGMSDELIAKVFNGPVTEGKARGNGLGLWSAIEQVRTWQGKFQIRPGPGAFISILLKKFETD